MIKFFVTTILICGFFAGCAQRSPTSSNESMSSEDRAIVAMAHTRLSQDPVTARLGLGIESSDGIVTLNGRIDSSTTKMRAVGIVRGVPGVRGVIDKTLQF